VIFPRTRGARQRYQRHKVIAIVVTFAVGWAAWKLLPDGALPARWTRPPPPTPDSAFRDRASGMTVEATAVVEEALPDSVDALGAGSLRRWRLRTVTGHPFVLVEDVLVEPPGAGPAPAPGDTLRVRGTYEWSNTGGTVRSAPSPPGGPSGAS
jgi:hypothetical protein